MATCAAEIWSSGRARPSAFVIAFPPNASSTLTGPNLARAALTQPEHSADLHATPARHRGRQPAFPPAGGPMFRTVIATLAAGAALATGIAVAPSDPVLAASRTTGQTACDRVWEALPEQMKNDIVAALSLEGIEQHRALLAGRYAALQGAYGAQVQLRARTLQHRRHELWKALPEQLKADVRAARSLPWPEQHRAMV